MPQIAQKSVRVRAGNGDIYAGKAVFVGCYWSGQDGSSVQLSLAPQQSAGISIDHVESIFVDNSGSNVPVTITSANPPQTLQIAAGATVNLHLDVSGLENPLTLATVGQANPFVRTYFIFRDYPVGASSTLATGASFASNVTETDLAAAAQNDPADNHAAIRVHDLGSYNALSGIVTLLGGTLATHDAVLDGIVSGGKLAVADSATAQLAGLIASGKLAVADSVLDALVSAGKLAVADASADAALALLVATILGTGASSRLATMLVDATATAFGTPGNPLNVVTRPGGVGTRSAVRIGTANGSAFSNMRAGPCTLAGGILANVSSGTVFLQVFDSTGVSGTPIASMLFSAGNIFDMKCLPLNFQTAVSCSITTDFAGTSLAGPTATYLQGTLVFQ